MTQNYEKLKKDLENLIDKFNKGWHEGIEIDASDIMLLNDLMEALSAITNAPSVETVTLPDGWKAVPVEPDRNQLDEIEKELKVCIARSLKTAARCIYKTFIKSAPTLNEKG